MEYIGVSRFEYIVVCFKKITHFFTREIFHALDANNDGCITEDEFVKGCLSDETFIKVTILVSIMILMF